MINIKGFHFEIHWPVQHCITKFAVTKIIELLISDSIGNFNVHGSVHRNNILVYNSH